MRILIGVALWLLFAPLSAQDTILFEYCLDAVVENSSRLRDKQLIDEQGRLIQQNVRTQKFPDLTINGKASYQSDVVSIAIDQPGLMIEFPEMPHGQFGLNLDVRQTIYDGGLTKQQKKYEQVSTATELQRVEVDLYSLKEQMAGLYLSALMFQENRKTLEIALENLTSREKVMTSAVKNGVAEESDLLLIRVELLKLLQSLSEVDASKEGVLRMMAVYLDREKEDALFLKMPYLEIADQEEIQRPELHLFDLQTDLMEAGKELTTVKRYPKIYAFGQAGLGMPGYNMLNDEIDSYYMVGAGLQWKIWDWNTVKREKQILEFKQQMTGNLKETFNRNVQAGLERELQSMEHLKSSISLDEKMLKMRMEITASAAAKLDNGVISATEYLQIVNDESRTRINRSAHQIQLIKAIVNYNLLCGTL